MPKSIGLVQTSMIAELAVTNSKLANGSVNANKLSQNSIAADMLANDSWGDVLSVRPKLAKAWAVFNGSTGAILEAVNVASITRNSAGDYTIQFANGMPTASYAVVASVPDYGAVNQAYRVGYSALGTGSFKLLAKAGVSTYVMADPPTLAVAIFSI